MLLTWTTASLALGAAAALLPGLEAESRWVWFAAAAIAGYLRSSVGPGAPESDVQITLADGSVRTLPPNSPEARELADLAHKLVETGL